MPVLLRTIDMNTPSIVQFISMVTMSWIEGQETTPGDDRRRWHGTTEVHDLRSTRCSGNYKYRSVQASHTTSHLGLSLESQTTFTKMNSNYQGSSTSNLGGTFGS